MNRLELVVNNNQLAGKRIIVTGCGYKPRQHTFYDATTQEPSHDVIRVNGEEMKLNIGAAVAGVLALNGATVHLISTSEEKLSHIKKYLDDLLGTNEHVEYSAIDLLDEKQVYDFAEKFPRDKTIYWVQSVGLGAGSYELKDDNPYLNLEDIPIELIEKESTTLLRATHLLMTSFLPAFRKQRETRIAIISSMSAVRGYPKGGAHCAAKGAIDSYANAAMLELYKENIFVTTIRPGAIDTRMYDNPSVQDAVRKIAATYGCDYSGPKFRVAPPTAVGQTVLTAFTTPAHIQSINLVAKGQFPNEGS